MVRSVFLRWGLPLGCGVLIFGCGPAERNSVPAERRAAPGAIEEPDAPVHRGVVLFLGTSLTDGYGLDREQAYPARVQAMIDSAGLPFEVVNAGLSGETSAGARRRVNTWLIRQPFDVLVIETGANDMLRGADVDSMRANIQAIVDTVRAVRPEARIVLAGMMAPPNLGAEYAERYRRSYVELARENGLTLIPFLLDEVGGQPEMNLPDGIHPNPAGHARVAGTVWETLEPVLRDEARRRRTAARGVQEGTADAAPHGGA